MFYCSYYRFSDDSPFLVIAAIIAPLPALFKGNLEINFNSPPALNQNIQNESYLNRIYMERYKQYELDCQRLLENAGIDGALVRINITVHNLHAEIINITVDLTNATIKEGLDVRQTVIKTIRSALRVEEGKIIIIH